MKRKIIKSSLIVPYFAGIFCLTLLIGCSDQTDISIDEKQLKEESVILSEDELQFRESLKTTAVVIVDVVQSLETVSVINNEVNADKSKESVLLKNLISETAENYRFKRMENPIREKFLSAMDKNENGSRVAGEDLLAFIDQENIEIFWPYQEIWDGKELPTITWDPLDNDYENIGFRLVRTASGELDTVHVLVNEEYAIEHPVWIIMKDKVGEHSDTETEDTNSSGRVATTNTEFSFQEIRINGNFRGIFGGKYHIVFLRGEAFINAQELPTTKHARFTKTVTRNEAKNKSWVPVYTAWDPDWTDAKTQQVIAIYDETNGGAETLKGKAKVVEPKTKAEIEVSFELKINTKTILYQMDWPRNWAMKLDSIPPVKPGDYRNGFPVINSGNISFTVRDRKI